MITLSHKELRPVEVKNYYIDTDSGIITIIMEDVVITLDAKDASELESRLFLTRSKAIRSVKP